MEEVKICADCRLVVTSDIERCPFCGGVEFEDLYIPEWDDIEPYQRGWMENEDH